MKGAAAAPIATIAAPTCRAGVRGGLNACPTAEDPAAGARPVIRWVEKTDEWNSSRPLASSWRRCGRRGSPAGARSGRQRARSRAADRFHRAVASGRALPLAADCACAAALAVQLWPVCPAARERVCRRLRDPAARGWYGRRSGGGHLLDRVGQPRDPVRDERRRRAGRVDHPGCRRSPGR